MQLSKWLTIKRASLLCFEMGLPRSTKSIRRWCANRDIEAKKRPNGRTEQWFIDRESLEIKIKEELEFLNHSEKPVPHSEVIAKQTADMSAYDRTQADVSGHERSQADVSGHERTQPDKQNQPQLRDLQDQILILKTDLKWREQVISDQKKQNEILLEEVKSQSQFIGHIKTQLLGTGQTPDQTFLAAPVPKFGVSEGVENVAQMPSPEIIQNERPHPDQSNLYTG